MHGFGQLGGWPQYPVPPQLLQGYQQDPYGILARAAWATNQMQNPWAQMQSPWAQMQSPWAQMQNPWAMNHMQNPWVVQALLGGLPYAALPFSSPLQPMIGGPFTQGSYGSSVGALGFGPASLGQPGFGPAFGPAGFGGGIGSGAIGGGLPFQTGVGNWSPAMAMV
jgi:hypothetical protein